MDAEFFIVTFIGVISLLSAFPVISEIRNCHPDYYKDMDGWGFWNNHGRGSWLFLKFILFHRGRIQDPVAYLCCYIYLFGVFAGVVFGVWVFLNVIGFFR